MRKILRINMSDLSVKEDTNSKYTTMGGRELTSTLVASEVSPTCHALSAENKLVFATGILTATPAPCSGRISVGTKSPLTGTIKEANAGGMAAIAMGKLGLAGIIIEGKPKDDTLYVLKINKDKAELIPSNELRSMRNYNLTDMLREKYGKKIAIMSIGPAGEYKLLAASIAITDPEGRPTRHAARGGVGAVMGSKGLKAVVLDTEGVTQLDIPSKEKFLELSKEFAKYLKAHPVTGEALPTYGTNILANIINSVGAYPTKNFSRGQYENVEKVSGEEQRKTILERGGKAKHACHPGCTIACSRTYNDKNGNYLTKGPEYETIWAHGANCEIDDLDAIAAMDRLDDDIGLDTIEMGATIGVAMESGLIKFGDAKGALNLLEEIGKGTPLGRIIGSGAKVTGQTFGVDRVPVVKGQAIPAYDPRAIKGIGVTYATSTMGADHTAGYAIATNVLKSGGFVEPLATKGQVDLSRNLQVATTSIDSTGLCLFIAFCILDKPEAFKAVCDMVGLMIGKPYTTDDFLETGRRILRLEREFNAKAGFTKKDDRLPNFFKNETLAPHNTVFDISDEEIDKTMEF